MNVKEKENKLFSVFKSYFISLDYPLINTMDDEQIAEIFKVPNRCFLISWVLKLLDSSYETTLKPFENNPRFLGNIIYELGFCQEDKKVHFMSGTMEIMEQLEILLRILKFTNQVVKTKPVENLNKNTSYHINVNMLKIETMNLNLFPQYGRIKGPEDIKNLPSSSENQKIINSDDDAQKYDVRDVEESLEKYNQIILNVKKNLEKYNSLSQLLVKKAESSKCDNDIKFQPDFNATLVNCNRSLEILLQYFKDVKTIQNFHNQKGHEEINIEDNTNLREALNILVKEFSVIKELIKS